MLTWIMLMIATALIVLTYWMWWRKQHRRMLELAALMPGPKPLPIIGNALLFMVKPEEQLNVIEDNLKKYGEYVRMWMGPELNVVVKAPRIVRRIDRSNRRICILNRYLENTFWQVDLLLTSGKINLKGPLYKLIARFIGPGILTGGPSWRQNRKLVNLSFSKKSLHTFTPVFNKEAEHFTETLLKKNPEDTFNVYLEVVRSTTQCVNQTIMGLSKEDSINVYRLDEIVAFSPKMYDIIYKTMIRWWLQIPIIYWLTGCKSNDIYMHKLIDDVTEDILSRRRKILEGQEMDENTLCAIDRLIYGDLPLQELKWEIFTMFTASQEATAKIAATVLVILAHSPEWQRKVYKEIMEVVGPHNEVTEDHLKCLHNLELVYKEAVRLMPIGAFIQRTVEEEISINEGKITLPVGCSVVIPIHTIHREEKYWDEPNKAKPERFLPEYSKNRDPNAYLPFSLGAMDCLGRVYGTALIKVMVIHALRKVTFECDGAFEDRKLEVAISVKFLEGYTLRVRPRKVTG